MGLSYHGGTMPGGITPICNECGTFLCWDISEEDAEQDRAFWDAWICETCNGGVRMSLKEWRQQHPQHSIAAVVAKPNDPRAEFSQILDALANDPELIQQLEIIRSRKTSCS